MCEGGRLRWPGPIVPLLELAADAAEAPTIAPLCRPKAFPAPSPIEERLPKPHPLTLPPPPPAPRPSFRDSQCHWLAMWVGLVP